MKALMIILTLLISFAAHSASKKEFLSKIEKGQELQKSYMLNGVPQNIQRLVIDKYKAQFKNFKDNMLYVHQWDDGDTIHILRYFWDDNVCNYTYLSKNQDFSKAPAQLYEASSPSPSSQVKQVFDRNSEDIDMKYCRSVYGF